MVEFYPSGEGRPAMGVALPEAHSMQMVGPWGRYLPQWLRAPCKGSGKLEVKIFLINYFVW